MLFCFSYYSLGRIILDNAALLKPKKMNLEIVVSFYT